MIWYLIHHVKVFLKLHLNSCFTITYQAHFHKIWQTKLKNSSQNLELSMYNNPIKILQSLWSNCVLQSSLSYVSIIKRWYDTQYCKNLFEITIQILPFTFPRDISMKFDKFWNTYLKNLWLCIKFKL